MVMLSNVCQPQKSSSKVQGASAKEQQRCYLQGPQNNEIHLPFACMFVLSLVLIV